jgi:hypothetical protein
MSSSAVAGQPGLDPLLPSVCLRVGGKDRHLCYDFNAIAQAEKLTSINLLAARVNFHDLSAGQMRGLLWAALITEDPAITLEQVGKLIHLGNMRMINLALAETWLQSVPEDVPPIDPKAHAQTVTAAA